jgi:CDGSH iron-sulfur domain-containing protein 3
MSDVKIRVKKNGPYVVTGVVGLTDGDGTAYPLTGEVIALCRCGHSANKPFCDGSHSAHDFVADESAS